MLVANLDMISSNQMFSHVNLLRLGEIMKELEVQHITGHKCIYYKTVQTSHKLGKVKDMEN